MLMAGREAPAMRSFYLHADQSTQALLHLKQSGIRTVVWLDGQAYEPGR